jgi:hypothetical protein
MWFGIKREDLLTPETKSNTSAGNSDDPNFGAQV